MLGEKLRLQVCFLPVAIFITYTNWLIDSAGINVSNLPDIRKAFSITKITEPQKQESQQQKLKTKAKNKYQR